MGNKESCTTTTAAPAKRSWLAPLASVKLTIFTMTLIAASVLIGAWCPQEAQSGQEKIIEQFGEQMAMNLIQWGIADIFHTPFFLSLIGLLTVNMVACSFQRVFPKIRTMKQQLPFLGAREIGKLPLNFAFAVPGELGETRGATDDLELVARSAGVEQSRREAPLAHGFAGEETAGQLRNARASELLDSAASGPSARIDRGMFNDARASELLDSAASGPSARNVSGMFNDARASELLDSAASGPSARNDSGMFNDARASEFLDSAASGPSARNDSGMFDDARASEFFDSAASGPSARNDSGVSNMLGEIARRLKRAGYAVRVQENRITGEFGKFAKLAGTVTHIGLLSLLVGVTITSWTGFSGFKPVRLHEELTFGDSEHSKLWIGKLPQWRVRVDATRREDYDTGDAKQWYSDLTVLSPDGKELMKKQISVNDPLSFGGTDVYQSSWGWDQAMVSFNGTQRKLQLRPMGKTYAAFLPLDQNTILIFSLRDPLHSARVFAKRPEWQAPKQIGEIPIHQTMMMGSVAVRYDGAIPVSGLQYKCDPGLPITYIAFAFIILGVLMATVPYRQIWVCVANAEGAPDQVRVAIGGRSNKAKVGFERWLNKLIKTISDDPKAPADQTISSAPAVEPERELVAGGAGKP